MAHDVARTGFTRAASIYDCGRPTYPPAAVAMITEWLREGTEADRVTKVVDLGAGSGTLTAALAAHRRLDAIAVDLVPEMLSRAPTGLQRVAAGADQLPLTSTSCDGVVAATAFHWFATPSTLREIHRVLRPSGRLVLVWNTRDVRVPWVSRYEQIVEPYIGDAPRYTTFAWKEAIARCEGFAEVDVQEIPNPTTTDRNGLVARAQSTSFIASLPPGDFAAVTTAMEALAASLPETFDYPYLCRVYCYETRPWISI